MAHIVAIRHVAFEHMGILEDLLSARHHTVHYVDAPINDFTAAQPEHHDLLVVLGAPIGAFDEADYPFLRNELTLLQHWIASAKPILGICLGAQLLARLLGADVKPMAHKEIGYAPLTLTAAGHASPLRHLADVPVLHWHGDAFTLPANAHLLAASAACPHQAFAVGTQILALQCHLEARPEQLEYWLVGHACELAQAGIHPPSLRDDAARFGPALHTAATRTLNAWLDTLCLS